MTSPNRDVQALGLDPEVLRADRALVEVKSGMTFILQATPVNLGALWRTWERTGSLGEFEYRPLTNDPYQAKRALHDIPIERVEDPELYDLLRESQLELDRKLTMLLDLGTPRYLQGSLQVYGGVAAPLLAEAEEVLGEIPPGSRGPAGEGKALPADRLQERALEEIEHYRSQDASFAPGIQIRKDMAASLLCSQGNLFIDATTRTPANRVVALLHHEIGTHLVTRHNGMAQPLHLLGRGLPGSVTLQEGLAVLAELLCGGLHAPRLRILAGRVVAVHTLVQGAELPETARLLEGDHGFPRREAFRIACRVHRGGGLTKDAVYFRGLRQVLDYVEAGHALEPLFVGKIALAHVPLVQELVQRGILVAPALRPRYLLAPECQARIERLRRGVRVSDVLRLSPRA